MKTPIYPGERFGDLTAVTKIRGSREHPTKWTCQCSCGNKVDVLSGSLRSGNTKSCGCKGSRATAGDRTRTHGRSHTPLYRAWQSMLNRCRNSKVPRYPDYGGRGIKVCQRWEVFENFLADMGVPEKGMTIERVDVNGNYEPGNCCWMPKAGQSNNRRYVHRLNYCGLNLTLIEWSALTGVTRGALYQRLREGQPTHRILREYQPSRAA